jgi:hypothetical protein
MAKGGARSRSGPAPDPLALRRERDAGEWTILPVEGRNGPVPDFPLLGETAREGELWERLWAKPQALMWERLGLHYEVALYVRRLAEAEIHDSRVNLSTLVRQMADSLGLTAPGMRANRWRITSEDTGEHAEGRPAGRTSRSSSRSRLKVVSGGDGS